MFVGGTETIEEIKYLIDDPMGTGARTIDLVDHKNRMKPLLEGLLGNKPGLRHRAVNRVHQQQYGVHHRQNPLNLTAKVSVAGSIDDIDPVTIPFDGRVFGQNGNTALTLLIIGIHDPFGAHGFAVQRTGLLQQTVHQGGFTVVNVGNNGDVAEIFDHRISRSVKNRRGL